MDNTLISDAERFFIIQGAQVGDFFLKCKLSKLDCRLDGRQRRDFRPIELETTILNHTAGSARVKMGNTIVITCVTIEIGIPSVDAPNEGRIEIDVECSWKVMEIFWMQPLLRSLLLCQQSTQKIASETADTSGTMDFKLSLTNLPLFTTVHKVGDSYIVDADKEEEACSFAR
ncbi:unnamed protein product [Hydatigera taeniaeformis]|uniref:Ribosomal RNA-processing protein 42 n=1 Tax=Hydatigena taeniaeformis TaxID=6205 RepID=A0A0R3WJY0_HYDTA|nr:unnamed protein product [Hydatigera taeniaeformis]